MFPDLIPHYDRFLWCVFVPGGELNPAAGGGEEPREAQSECQASRSAELEESGGDHPDGMPFRTHPRRPATADHQRPAVRPARQGVNDRWSETSVFSDILQANDVGLPVLDFSLCNDWFKLVGVFFFGRFG